MKQTQKLIWICLTLYNPWYLGSGPRTGGQFTVILFRFQMKQVLFSYGCALVAKCTWNNFWVAGNTESPHSCISLLIEPARITYRFDIYIVTETTKHVLIQIDKAAQLNTVHACKLQHPMCCSTGAQGFIAVQNFRTQITKQERTTVTFGTIFKGMSCTFNVKKITKFQIEI
jgi:hypothetical protein